MPFKKKYRRILIVAAFAIICGAIFVFWKQNRPDPSRKFRWNDLYFACPSPGRIRSESTYQDLRYIDCKGELLGTILWEGTRPIPERNRESYRIAAGTKIYTIDPIRAEEKGLTFCGLLMETEGGGLYYAYPYCFTPEDALTVDDKIYEAFYPDFVPD